MKVQLTQSQSEAVNHFRGAAIVMAGPGAGKTRVLIERIAFLVGKKGVSPSAILATTFTEKAAIQLRHRLRLRLGSDSNRTHVSTIHSLCKTILEDSFQEHRLGSQFGVLDSDSQELFILANRSKLNLGGRKGWRDLIIRASGFQRNYEGEVAAFYNTLTENQINPETLREELEKTGKLEHDAERLLESYSIYLDLLEEEKLLDFANLQMRALLLIRDNHRVQTNIQNRYQFILVDEYQDTSPLQDEIFRLIAGEAENLFVVGDEHQSIYGFRGASIENFTKFVERYPNAKEYFLTDNFRSFKNIVETANRILEGKLRRELKAHRKEGNRILQIQGGNRKEVAEKAVAFLQREMQNSKLSAKDICFLYRKKAIADGVIAALEQADIPYHTDSDGKFLEREDIQSILNLFSYLFQEDIREDEFKEWKSWWHLDLFDNSFMDFQPESMQILRELPREFDLAKLRTATEISKLGIRNKRDKERLLALQILKQKIADKEVGLLDALYEILKITEAISLRMESGPEGEESVYNIAQLTKLLGNYERQMKRPSAKGFLYLLQNRGHRKSLDEILLKGKDTVQCMTIHKSKGLEFPAVVINSFVEGDFPILFRMEETVCGVPIPIHFFSGKRPSLEEALHYQEELRLFYVAATRAQDLLLITIPTKIPGRKVEPSRFLELIQDYTMEVPQDSCEWEKEYELPDEPTSLSYNSVETYLDCPMNYKFQYVYEFQTPQNWQTQLGLVIHELLQRMNQAIQGEETIDADFYEDIMQMHWRKFGKKKEDEKLQEEVREGLGKYLEFARENLAEILSVEEAFQHSDPSFFIRGRTDLIAKSKNGEVWLIDFKTGKSQKDKPESLQRQLSLYRYSLPEFDIQSMGIYDFWKAQLSFFPYKKEEIENDLQRVSDGLKKEDFSHKPKVSECEGGNCFFSFICKELPNVRP